LALRVRGSDLFNVYSPLHGTFIRAASRKGAALNQIIITDD
jgi:hypothetical protein